MEIARNRRRKQQDQNRNKQIICYHCRQHGHSVTNCPSKPKTELDDNSICYKCGSTEHSLSNCPKRNHGKATDLPFASCFLCKQKGHLISQCPQNAKGIYVNGGECRKCGSREHVASKCPEKRKSTKENEEGNENQENINDLLECDSSHPAQKLEEEKKKGVQRRRIVKF